MRSYCSLMLMLLCVGCKILECPVLTATEMDIATDDLDSILIIQITNLTDKAVAFHSCDFDHAFKAASYHSIDTGTQLEVIQLVGDELIEIHDELVVVDSMSSCSMVVVLPIQIKGVSVGDNILWSLEAPLEMCVRDVRVVEHLKWKGSARIVSRDEAIRKALAIQGAEEFYDDIMRNYMRRAGRRL